MGDSEARGKKRSRAERREVEKCLSRNGIYCIQNDRRPCDLNSESLLMIYDDTSNW